MSNSKIIFNELKILLTKQNFLIIYEQIPEKDLNTFFAALETLFLLKKVKPQKGINSKIYLAMLHQKFKNTIHLNSPPSWQIQILVILGKILGFRIP